MTAQSVFVRDNEKGATVWKGRVGAWKEPGSGGWDVNIPTTGNLTSGLRLCGRHINGEKEMQ